MISDHHLWAYIDFTFSDYKKSEIDDTAVKIWVRDLWVLKGFQDSSEDRRYGLVVLVFEDVV